MNSNTNSNMYSNEISNVKSYSMTNTPKNSINNVKIISKFDDICLRPLYKYMSKEEFDNNFKQLNKEKYKKLKYLREHNKKESISCGHKLIKQLDDYTICEGDIPNSNVHFRQLSQNITHYVSNPNDVKSVNYHVNKSNYSQVLKTEVSFLKVPSKFKQD